MRAESINAPTTEPWMSSVHPLDTLDVIASCADGKSGDVMDVGEPEHEGQTTLLDRTVISLSEQIAVVEVASQVAIEAPTPLPEPPGARSVPSAVLRLTRIAKYELIEEIGHGSFGLVYTARDTELDREVALKILNPSHHGDAEALHRFLREARAAARIAHPGIITVHDCGRYAPDGCDELAYIAMERLGGESLTRRLDRVGRLRFEEAAEIARQVASALDAVHRADVLHRDLKPDNVFLVPDPAVPSGERAKVLDFGLAKIGSSRHTLLGSVFGTPLYMSPEQCRSSGCIDARSDIYSLGCILFELLAGRAPFEGAIYKVVEQHLHERAPSVASVTPGIPAALDALVAAMLEKDPDRRPPTMGDVVRWLQGVLAAPIACEDDAIANGPRPAAPAPAPGQEPEPGSHWWSRWWSRAR